MVPYPSKEDAIYAIHTTPLALTYLFLPAGEGLAAPPSINTDRFATGVVQMGSGPTREEVVVVRLLQTGQKPTQTALSGRVG